MFELNGKIAIVTGASQGIGHKISHTLAKSGATVICVARSEKKIESLAILTETGSDWNWLLNFLTSLNVK